MHTKEEIEAALKREATLQGVRMPAAVIAAVAEQLAGEDADWDSLSMTAAVIAYDETMKGVLAVTAVRGR